MVEYQYFFLSRFKKVKIDFYVYIHIILAIKLFKLVNCSGEIDSLLIISPKISSTLNEVFFIISLVKVLIINLFQFLRFFSSIFSSTIKAFNVFSYNRVIILIESLNLVHLIFNFEISSFLIKIAIDVKKAVELITTIPMLRFINDIVEVVIAYPDPNKISVINNITFF